MDMFKVMGVPIADVLKDGKSNKVVKPDLTEMEAFSLPVSSDDGVSDYEDEEKQGMFNPQASLLFNMFYVYFCFVSNGCLVIL